jgi:hypothetical protein
MADVLRLTDRFDGLTEYPVCRAYVVRATTRPAFVKAHADQTAGPVPETKAVVGGFSIIEVPSRVAHTPVHSDCGRNVSCFKVTLTTHKPTPPPNKSESQSAPA